MKNLFPKIEKEILDLFSKYNNFIIVGHEKPDGDCLGSQLGFSVLLKNLNKNYVLLNSGPFTKEKDLEPFFKNSITEKEKKDALVVVLDCSVKQRIGEVYSYIENLPTLVIDHHESGSKEYGDYTYIIPSSPSTTLLVIQFFKALDTPLTKEASDYLLFGFLTDTGCFRFISKEQSQCLTDVKLLLDAGSSIALIYDKAFNNFTKETLEYKSNLLTSTKFVLSDKIAIVKDTKELYEKYGEDNRDMDSVFKDLNSLKTVQAIISYKYTPNKTGLSFSLRSKNSTNIDVGQICAYFDGGGHKHAGGFTTQGIVDDIIDKVITLIKKQIN